MLNTLVNTNLYACRIVLSGWVSTLRRIYVFIFDGYLPLSKCYTVRYISYGLICNNNMR